MDQKKFKSLLSIARSMQMIDSDRSYFWRGFRRGLQRNYHGENFGTAEEHERWMHSTLSKCRKQVQQGYRAGFYYDQLKIDGPGDIRPLRDLLGLSVSDLAAMAGVSPRTVEGWEQGRPMSRLAIRQLRRELLIG
jgi:DNA-binding transcriptional regulator YiaG